MVNSGTKSNLSACNSTKTKKNAYNKSNNWIAISNNCNNQWITYQIYVNNIKMGSHSWGLWFKQVSSTCTWNTKESVYLENLIFYLHLWQWNQLMFAISSKNSLYPIFNSPTSWSNKAMLHPNRIMLCLMIMKR